MKMRWCSPKMLVYTEERSIYP